MTQNTSSQFLPASAVLALKLDHWEAWEAAYLTKRDICLRLHQPSNRHPSSSEVFPLISSNILYFLKHSLKSLFFWGGSSFKMSYVGMEEKGLDKTATMWSLPTWKTDEHAHGRKNNRPGVSRCGEVTELFWASTFLFWKPVLQDCCEV